MLVVSCLGLSTVLAAAAPAIAADTASSSVVTTFFGSANGAGAQEPIKITVSRTGKAGETVTNEQDQSATAGGSLASAHASGNAAPGRLGVAVSGQALAQAFREDAQISATATSTVNDVLTIQTSAAIPLGRVIHVENRLTLDGSTEDAVHAFAGFSNGHFLDFTDAAASAGLNISGTGIEKGPRGNSVFGLSFDVFSISGQVVRDDFLAPPASVLFSMDFVAGIPTFTTLTMSATGFASADSLDQTNQHDALASFMSEFSHTLAWSGATTFRDAVTGEILEGVSVVSESGFDYAHPGGVTAPGGVPEPATWAMMIVGFGGAGAMIRRRRSAFV